MKQKICTLAAALAFFLPAAANAEEMSATIEVNELYCSSCPYIAAQAIMSVPSATIVDGYYDPDAQMAQFVVLYDDTATSLERLIAATSDYGYPAHQIEQITPEDNS